MSVPSQAPYLPFVMSALLASAPLAGAEPAPDAAAAPAGATRVLDLTALTGLDNLVEELARRRVVFIGEQHDRYETHLDQLAILQGLHARGVALVIGLEWFQQPFQPHLDDYVAGTIDETELLARTEYFDRWGYDYRLYRPILRFARDRKIPLIALNLDQALTRRVGEVGSAGLTADESARLPTEIDRGDADYRARLESIFALHPVEQRQNLEHFIEVQLLWDEGMAERAARALDDHPECLLAVLAGSGHLEYGQGIPSRLLRRRNVPAAIVLNGAERTPDPRLADYLLYPEPVALPAAGLLGVLIDPDGDGDGALIQGFADQSGAAAAGLRPGDRIVRVGERAVTGFAGVRIALIDARPGARVPVTVRRGAEQLDFEVELR